MDERDIDLGEAERLFKGMERLRLYPPGGLFEQLEYFQEVEAALEFLNGDARPREMVLETWLMVDEVLVFLLRDGLGWPDRLAGQLRLIPSSFERKLTLLDRLKTEESKVLPNQASYTAYEFHPLFFDQVARAKQGALIRELNELAIAFEAARMPEGAEALPRHAKERSRIVPEWWYEAVGRLDDGWFTSCRMLNAARNIAAHRRKGAEKEIFGAFKVSGEAALREALRTTLTSILFR